MSVKRVRIEPDVLAALFELWQFVHDDLVAYETESSTYMYIPIVDLHRLDAMAENLSWHESKIRKALASNEHPVCAHTTRGLSDNSVMVCLRDAGHEPPHSDGMATWGVSSNG